MILAELETISARDVQNKRAREDFERIVGGDVGDVLYNDRVQDLNIRPNGHVIQVHRDEGRGRVDGLHVTPDRSQDIARAMLQTLNPIPELNDVQQSVDFKMTLDGDNIVRVHIDGPPAVGPGYHIAMRKQKREAKTLEEDWVEPGFMDARAIDVFRWCADAKRNVVFCGKMFSGKTRLRNNFFRVIAQRDPKRAMVEIADVDESICDLEDYVVLNVNQHRSARDYCQSFVRMSSESVGVNELRGPEAYDLFNNLWISDHNGSSTTFHVSDAEEFVWRAGTLVTAANQGPANLEVIAKAAHVLVFIRYNKTRGRKVARIVHVKGVKPHGGLDVEDLIPPVDWPEDEEGKRYVCRA